MRFRIAISAQEYLRYYQGEVDSVQVKTVDGRIIQFPASSLQRYVDQSGVHGSFRIIFDENNKLVRVERVSS